jgi:hypothetical protein
MTEPAVVAKPNLNRVKLYAVPVEELLKVFVHGQEIHWIVTEGFPPDAKALRTAFNRLTPLCVLLQRERGMFFILVYSESFEALWPTPQIPEGRVQVEPILKVEQKQEAGA